MKFTEVKSPFLSSTYEWYDVSLAFTRIQFTSVFRSFKKNFGLSFCDAHLAYIKPSLLILKDGDTLSDPTAAKIRVATSFFLFVSICRFRSIPDEFLASPFFRQQQKLWEKRDVPVQEIPGM
jgi:hypothetical protein